MYLFVTFLLPGRLVKGLLDLTRLWLALVSLFGHLIVIVSVPDGHRSGHYLNSIQLTF